MMAVVAAAVLPEQPYAAAERDCCVRWQRQGPATGCCRPSICWPTVNNAGGLPAVNSLTANTCAGVAIVPCCRIGVLCVDEQNQREVYKWFQIASRVVWFNRTADTLVNVIGKCKHIGTL